MSALLRGAVELLWLDYLGKAEHTVSPHKSSFESDFNSRCLPLLEMVIYEWFHEYGCEGSYRHFYAIKLSMVARIVMQGEKRKNELMDCLRSKPKANKWNYSSDAWIRLDREIV